jgi:hypothetical protein
MTIQYLVDENLSPLYQEQLKRYLPESTILVFGIRIGYKTAVSFGGILERDRYTRRKAIASPQKTNRQ